MTGDSKHLYLSSFSTRCDGLADFHSGFPLLHVPFAASRHRTRAIDSTSPGEVVVGGRGGAWRAPNGTPSLARARSLGAGVSMGCAPGARNPNGVVKLTNTLDDSLEAPLAAHRHGGLPSDSLERLVLPCAHCLTRRKTEA